MCAVDYAVNEEEPAEEFGGEYREPEPEDPYREQEFPEGLEDGKFNLLLWCILNPNFINTTYKPDLQIVYEFYCWDMVG